MTGVRNVPSLPKGAGVSLRFAEWSLSSALLSTFNKSCIIVFELRCTFISTSLLMRTGRKPSGTLYCCRGPSPNKIAVMVSPNQALPALTSIVMVAAGNVPAACTTVALKSQTSSESTPRFAMGGFYRKPDEKEAAGCSIASWSEDTPSALLKLEH